MKAKIQQKIKYMKANKFSMKKKDCSYFNKIRLSE